LTKVLGTKAQGLVFIFLRVAVRISLYDFSNSSYCHYFYQTDYWDFEILLDDHLFCSPIAVLQAII